MEKDEKDFKVPLAEDKQDFTAPLDENKDLTMKNQSGSKKITVHVTKATVAMCAIFIVLGYFIGVSLPIQNFLESKETSSQLTSPSIGKTNQAVDSSQTTNISLPSTFPFLGSEDASINIIEFGDYQCPFCGRFFKNTEPVIMDNYVNTGKTKFYFLDFVIVGPDSLTLAQGAWCARDQGKYYEYHDYVYSHQGEENSGWGTTDKIKAFVGNIPGIDVQAFSSCLDSKKYESQVMQITQSGQKLGITGTPTAFIGNNKVGYVKITGAQPYDVFKQVIDKQLG